MSSDCLRNGDIVPFETAQIAVCMFQTKCVIHPTCGLHCVGVSGKELYYLKGLEYWISAANGIARERGQHQWSHAERICPHTQVEQGWTGLEGHCDKTHYMHVGGRLGIYSTTLGQLPMGHHVKWLLDRRDSPDQLNFWQLLYINKAFGLHTLL